MNTWPVVNLEDLRADEPNSLVDGPFGSDLKTSDYTESGIPLIRIQNVRPNSFLPKDTKYVSPKKAQQLRRHDYRPGDLVITKLGDPCGVACIVPEEAGQGLIVADIVRFRGNPTLVDHGFLSHFINSPNAIKWIDREAKGTTRQRVNLSNFRRLPVPLPSIPEQRRIADILDKAEALRAKRRAALALLDSLTQAIFLDMFGDPATNPEGWLEKKLGELIMVGPQNGLYKPASDYGSGIPILRIDAFYDGVLTKLATLKRVRISPDEQALYALREGEIVINRVNSREYLGKSAIIPALKEVTVFESNMMRLDVDRHILSPGYFIQYLQTSCVRRHILRSAKDAVNQSSINQQDVKALPVVLPPISLQREFARRVAVVDKLKATHRASLAEMYALFASLQHRAFRGEL